LKVAIASPHQLKSNNYTAFFGIFQAGILWGAFWTTQQKPEPRD
jgi:hypothetical protein